MSTVWILAQFHPKSIDCKRIIPIVFYRASQFLLRWDSCELSDPGRIIRYNSMCRNEQLDHSMGICCVKVKVVVSTNYLWDCCITTLGNSNCIPLWFLGCGTIIFLFVCCLSKSIDSNTQVCTDF